MGSGVLLAILVALWFVVLVPMVVTRGELATTPAEPMRVLRRRSDRSAMSNSAMSNGPQPTSSRASPTAGAENMLTEPIPVLPAGERPSESGSGTSAAAGTSGPRVTATVALPAELPSGERPSVDGPAVGAQPPVPQRPEDQIVAEQQVSGPPEQDKTVSGDVDIRSRRARMLTGLVVLAVFWALFAAFWKPVLWWPQIVLDLIVFSYLVFLRLEAQREQDRDERRRARTATRLKMPEDRTQRLVRAHTQYQAHVTAATEHQAIALDDDDPGFAEIPTWNPAPTPDAVAEPPAWHERKAV